MNELIVVGLDNVVEKAGDSEGADTASDGGNGGKVGALTNFVCEIAL